MARRKGSLRVPRGFGRFSGRYVSRKKYQALVERKRQAALETKYIREAERAERLAEKIEAAYERAEEARYIEEARVAERQARAYEREARKIHSEIARVLDRMLTPEKIVVPEPRRVRPEIPPPPPPRPESQVRPIVSVDETELDSILERALYRAGFESSRVRFSSVYDLYGRTQYLYEVVSREPLEPEDVRAVRDIIRQILSPEYGTRPALVGVKVGTPDEGRGDVGWRSVTFTRELDSALNAIDYKVEVWSTNNKYEARQGFFGVFVRVGAEA